MFLTLAQAAEATGKSKSTLLRAVKKGQVSAHRDDSGAFWVDPAELHRVFPAVGDARHGAQMTHQDAGESGHDAARVAILERDLAHVRELLEREREATRDLARRLDQEAEERRKLTALLTHDKASRERDQAQDQGKGKLYERLFGRDRKQETQ